MGCGDYDVKIDDDLLKKLAIISNGDVRTALNGLEVAVLTTKMRIRWLYTYNRRRY